MNPTLDLVLVGEGNLARVLPAGQSVIMPAGQGLEGPTCGLIPLGGPAVATTTGLKWNLGEKLPPTIHLPWPDPRSPSTSYHTHSPASLSQCVFYCIST